MKSEIHTPDPVSQFTFPLLARIKSTSSLAVGTVVLFTSPNCGTVVHSTCAWNIGSYRGDWVALSSTTHWEILPTGTQVVITNQ